LTRERSSKEMPSAEEVRETLRAVREEVPGLLRELVGPLKELLVMSLDEEQARHRARAIAAFYKELIEAGMDKEAALALTKEQFVNPVSLLRNAFRFPVKYTEGWRKEEEEY